MSQREDRVKTAVIPALAGVNERSAKTDLQPQELTLVEGTYPGLTGQQLKIPGKYLLALFEESVYGIHQMWTPYGYGTNIYQFDGKIGSDPWITPPGKPIKPDPLPPSPWGPDQVIIDETGNHPENPGTNNPPVPTTGVGGNGTVSTPTGPTGGGDTDPPPPPPANFDLKYTILVMHFGGGGIQARDCADALFVYSTNPINPLATLIGSVSARSSDAERAEWNELHPEWSVTKQVQPQIGTASVPVPAEGYTTVGDPVVGSTYPQANGPFWIAYKHFYFVDTGEVHIQPWNGYYL